MATTRYPANDLRRQVGSPKSSKGGENRDTPCRNIRIYGRCRYEDQGCTFNHDMDKNSSQTDFSAKKAFNVDSPSFTPSNQILQQQQQQQQQQSQMAPTKKSTFSSQAASAAPFTPRAANATPTLQPSAEPSMFNIASVKEFKPQNYDTTNTNSGNGVVHDNGPYNDPFTTVNSIGQTLPSVTQFNPYASEQPGLGGGSTTFYPQHGSYPVAPLQPPQFHLYQPYDSYRSDLQPWQRSTYDFFISDKLREEMQKKSFATQQTMPNSGLPNLDRYHNLFPLDTSNRKNASSFGYSSWVYKAQSTRNGRHYALRRIEGYRLTNENAILAVMKEWKKIKNANIVTVHEAFTTRDFGDSSLVFAYDHHPLAKTLQEHHFQSTPGTRMFRGSNHVQEPILWGYICQIANALRAIHSSKLAARCIELSKIIVSEKNRIRLSACSILDVVQFENPRPIAELQQQDLINFGKVILALATNNPSVQVNNIKSAMDALGTKYTATFKEAVLWLATASPSGEVKTIGAFLTGISAQMASHFDLAMQDSDEKSSVLAKELENGRLVRILMKLNTINERGDMAGIPNWSETGDRYQLKLFRDYVFHQVEADGKPRLSIGHMISCLSKLDASVDEPVVMTSRDNKIVFIPTYRELRVMFDRAFNELVKHSKHGAPGAN